MESHRFELVTWRDTNIIFSLKYIAIIHVITSIFPKLISFK